MNRVCRVAALLAAAALVSAGCSNGGDAGDEPSPSSGARIAVADAVSVRVRSPDGAFTTVAAVPTGARVEGLVWSADGARLAWLTVDDTTGRVRVAEAPVGGGDPREWACPDSCGAVAFRDDDLVSDGGLPGTILRYDAATPEPVTLTGLPDSDVPLTLLASTGHDDGLLVATAGGVYRVDADDTASLVDEAPAGPHEGALSPDATQLAYTVAGTVPSCPATEAVLVVDLATGEDVTVEPPSATRPQFVSDVWFDDAGTAYASIVDGPGGCTPAAAPEVTTAAQVYRRDSTTWSSTGARARRGADLGGGRSALLTGPLTVGPDGVRGAAPGTLTLSDGGGPDQVVAEDVTAFAVSPR